MTQITRFQVFLQNKTEQKENGETFCSEKKEMETFLFKKDHCLSAPPHLKLGYDLFFGGKAHDPVGDFVGVGLRPFGNFSPRGENRCGVTLYSSSPKEISKGISMGSAAPSPHIPTVIPAFFRLGYYIFYRSQN